MVKHYPFFIMNRFKVLYTEILTHEVEVLAESPEKAFEAVSQGEESKDNATIVDDDTVDSIILNSRYTVESTDDDDTQCPMYFYI